MTRRPLLLSLSGWIALLALAACGGAAGPAPTEAAVEEPEVEAEETEEAVEEPAEEKPEVIYGTDDRQEVYAHPDERLRNMAASVALLVADDRVQVSGEQVELDGPILSERLRAIYDAPLCDDELYGGQLSPGHCTGFLIADDVLITAGHCLVDGPSCENTRIIFGFQVEPGGNLAPLTSDQVFGCREVLAASQDKQNPDYAIIRLDRPAGRPTLTYSTVPDIPSSATLVAIGHPASLPLKIASGAEVTDPGVAASYFTANLDTFGGSSGSPVIDLTTYEVVGMLVSGEQDYVIAPGGVCVELNRCEESGDDCSGEHVLKMSALSAELETVLNPDEPEQVAPQFCAGILLIGMVAAPLWLNRRKRF